MPQFDTATFLPQLVWLAVIFAVLYFAVVRPTLPKVGRVIDERESRVAGDLDAAETAKRHADAIRAQYDDGMAAARESAQTEVAAAKASAAQAVETQLRDLGRVLDGRAVDAAVTLAAAQDAARATLAATTTELTAAAVQRLTGLTAAPAEIEAALAAQK